ncbi:hypothetical protein OAI75_02905 [Woeseiaceae bacterium]|nr:hypothetical protein [Woeseiaceae bacterium]
MSRPVDNFFAAVSVLAGHGHIKQRLISAYEDNLTSIEKNDLPISMKESFADLQHLMSRVKPSNGEGEISASVRKMSVEEANQCAQFMVDLYSDMLHYSDSVQASLPLYLDEESSSIPPFLVKTG